MGPKNQFFPNDFTAPEQGHAGSPYTTDEPSMNHQYPILSLRKERGDFTGLCKYGVKSFITVLKFVITTMCRLGLLNTFPFLKHPKTVPTAGPLHVLIHLP